MSRRRTGSDSGSGLGLLDLYLLIVGLVTVAMLFGIYFAISYFFSMDAMHQLNPPQEVWEGRVSNIVTTKSWSGQSNSEDTWTIVANLCSGATWDIPEKYKGDIEFYVNNLAPHHGCQ